MENFQRSSVIFCQAQKKLCLHTKWVSIHPSFGASDSLFDLIDVLNFRISALIHLFCSLLDAFFCILSVYVGCTPFWHCLNIPLLLVKNY
jgi:hypothetical protein